MKTLIDIEQWERKEHYLYFSKLEEPFFGITVQIDCTKAYQISKQKKHSFFLHYLYRALRAANETHNFRYRILDGKVYLFDQIDASPTVDRGNGMFGFSYMFYNDDEDVFYEKAQEEMQRVRQTTKLFPPVAGENVIHFSALPWLNFTALSHARGYSIPDSAPKISFGKMTEINNQKTMPISIHVHHALIDGYHIGLFVDKFQELMDGF